MFQDMVDVSGNGRRFARGISKQVHQNSPSSCIFRATLQQSALPRTEKVFAAFKPKPRINCAFQPHCGRFLKTRPAFMLGGLPCPARNHGEEQQELWL